MCSRLRLHGRADRQWPHRRGARCGRLIASWIAPVVATCSLLSVRQGRPTGAIHAARSPAHPNGELRLVASPVLMLDSRSVKAVHCALEYLWVAEVLDVQCLVYASLEGPRCSAIG